MEDGVQFLQHRVAEHGMQHPLNQAVEDGTQHQPNQNLVNLLLFVENLLPFAQRQHLYSQVEDGTQQPPNLNLVILLLFVENLHPLVKHQYQFNLAVDGIQPPHKVAEVEGGIPLQLRQVVDRVVQPSTQNNLLPFIENLLQLVKLQVNLVVD
jgi:hypothetical protein